MTEGPKKASKKFKFFKFKGLGSLSNLPRSFTLKRSSASLSIRSHLEQDTFEATQDDMMTVPQSPPAYARSSDMYSHMGTMPRHSTKKARDQQATQETKEVGSESHLVPQDLPNPPGLEAAKEVVVGTNAPLEDTPAVGPNPSVMGPTGEPEDPSADRKEERAPRNVPPERAAGEPEAGGDYVKVRGAGQGTLDSSEPVPRRAEFFSEPCWERDLTACSQEERVSGSARSLGSGFTPEDLLPMPLSPSPKHRTPHCLLPPDPTHLPAGQGPEDVSLHRPRSPNPTRSLSMC